jgi:two-component system chemotaxis sensor kinase CheA
MDNRDNSEDAAENILPRLRELFREEAYELVAELEAALLELEKDPHDQELIGRVFRALHTIKGSGAACELKGISVFAHEVETLFDGVRKGQIDASHEIIALTLSARDQMKALFDECYCEGAASEAKTREIVASIKAMVPAAEEKSAGASQAPQNRPGPSKDRSGTYTTYRIRFRPAQTIFRRGINPVFLLNDLRQLGPCRVVAQLDAVPRLEDMDPEACYTCWDVILTTGRGVNAIHDVFLFVKDEIELKIDVIDDDGRLDDEVSYKKLGEILLERGDLSGEDLQAVLQEKKRVGELLVETGLVSGSQVQSALIEQQMVRTMREKSRNVDAASSIRVSISKLDSLVNLVGELVTIQARLSRASALGGDPEFLSIAEEVERLTAGLRDNAMSIRMLPIETMFGRFKRLVQDLSRGTGKEVELVTEGAETELDKTVIERLSDPLVHLIRNSADHGIETPEAREAAGKPRAGVIRLSAAHSGGHVLIRVKDDGAGLDREAIRAKAVEKGLLQPAAVPTDRELFSLIFTPGFSTAGTVTDVSGRGVGLDVVKKAIDALRGSIELASQKGLGTTVTLKLPLTLAVIDGLLVKIAQESFVLPLSFVHECVELTGEDKNNAHRRLANVRGEIVPYINLRERFFIPGDPPGIEQIVITEIDGSRVGFVVDSVIGGHQTVIKNLGTFYRDVEGVSGATILGDGTVALILDAPGLVREEEVRETGQTA